MRLCGVSGIHFLRCGEQIILLFFISCIIESYIYSFLMSVTCDNIMVALYVLPLLVLAVFQIGAHTRYGKIFITTIQRGNAVIITENKPPVPVQCGLHGKLVMLKS